MIRDIHHLTMVHIIYTIVHGRITVSGIAFLNFEVASVVVHCRCLLTGKG